MGVRTIHFSVTDGPDYKFRGTCLAEVRENNKIGRWRELALYRTVRGAYVCFRASLTQWESEKDRYEAATVHTKDEVIEWFGQDDLAHSLYDSAGLDNSFDPDAKPHPNPMLEDALRTRLNQAEIDALNVLLSAAQSWANELGEYVIDGSRQAGDEESAEAQQQEHDDILAALELFGTYIQPEFDDDEAEAWA